MENELKQLGFSEKETTIYLALLKVGSASVARLNKDTAIPRPTVYDILHILVEKGLITAYKKDKKSFYDAVEPEEILRKLKEKEDIAKKIMPELKKLRGIIEKRPSVQIYEGKKGMLSLLNEIYKEKELLVYGSAKKSQEILGHLPENFARRRTDLKIKMKAILEKSKEALIRIEDENIRKYTEIRFLDKMNKLPTVTFIYGQNVSIISIENELIGIKIEDKNVAETQKIIFEELWEKADEMGFIKNKARDSIKKGAGYGKRFKR